MICLLIPLALLVALIAAAYILTPQRERLSLREFAGDDCFVRVAGYDIHYQDNGPRDATPVLLAHGFGTWSFTWRAQRLALIQAGYRVITTDQIGYGASSRPAAPVYTTQLQAELILGVLDALRIESAHWVGHSFGARVAMQAALLAPARVRSLVAIAPEAFSTERPPIAKLVDVPLLGYALAFYSSMPQLVRPGLKYVSKDHSWLTEDAIAGYAAPARVRGTTAAQVGQARSPKDGAQPVPSNLGAITQRTLLIWGAADPVFPLADARRLVKLLPNATLQVFEDVGHLPHEERSIEVTAAMLGFLSEDQGRTTNDEGV